MIRKKFKNKVTELKKNLKCKQAKKKIRNGA